MGAAGVAAVLAAIPLLYIAVRTGSAGLEAVATVLARPRLPALLINTIALVAGVTCAATVLGVATAFILARVRLRWTGALAAVSMLPLAVPSYLAAFGWLAALPRIHGYAPSWLVLTVVTTPYVTLPVTAALRGMPPAFGEVARTLGYSPLQTFRSVTWPGIRNAALAGSLLVSLYALADFGGVALFRYPVLTTAIQQAYGATFDRTYAPVLSCLLVAIALGLLVLERRVRPRRGFALGRDGAVDRIEAGRWTPALVAVVLLAPLSAVLVPLASLFSRLLSAQTVRELDVGRLASATASTVLLSVAGAAIALALALPIATLGARYPGRAAQFAEIAGSLPLAIPGIVVGLGLVYFALRAAPALYQTAGLLAFAYGILFLPKAIGSTRSAIERVPDSLEDVAATLGYGRFARWRLVTLRLSRPGIAMAGIIVAVTAMKELPATLMLRPTGLNTLALELWTTTDVAAYGAAVPYAVALVLVAAVPAVALAPREQRLSAPVPVRAR